MSYSNELVENEMTDVYLPDLGLVYEVYGHGLIRVKNILGTVLATVDVTAHKQLSGAPQSVRVTVS